MSDGHHNAPALASFPGERVPAPGGGTASPDPGSKWAAGAPAAPRRQPPSFAQHWPHLDDGRRGHPGTHTHSRTVREKGRELQEQEVGQTGTGVSYLCQGSRTAGSHSSSGARISPSSCSGDTRPWERPAGPPRPLKKACARLCEHVHADAGSCALRVPLCTHSACS